MNYNITEAEKAILSEFYRNKGYRIDFIGKSEEEVTASEWCCSDEIKCMETWDIIDSLEDRGFIYCWDDDYYRLTAKGLEAYREIESVS